MDRQLCLTTFCHNIRFLRAKYGLSKQTMASILGIGLRTLNALEADTPSLRLNCSTLVHAAMYFGLTTDELLYDVLQNDGG